METEVFETMGMSLCKNRGNREGSPMSPVDRVIGGCAQICPQSIGKKKHFWDKQVLETSPPLNQQPKFNSSGWETATLSVPDSPCEEDNHPIAPPRKKRSTKLNQSGEVSSNNSKEFTPNQNSNHTFAASPNKKDSENELPSNEPGTPISQKDCETENSVNENNPDKTRPVALTRKISKVGNKKSDKFFGENLSDCLSDEPISPDEKKKESSPVEGAPSKDEVESPAEEALGQDEAESPAKESPGRDEVDRVATPEQNLVKTDSTEAGDKFVVEDVEETDEMIRKINKEKGNLIFAIEKGLNKKSEVEYEDRSPVKEEIIVPIRRVPRHICDDEDHLHKILSKTIPDPNAPKKPQRDFSKYKKSIEILKSESTESSQEKNSSDKGAPTTINETSLEPESSPKKLAEDEITSVTSETETIPAEDLENHLAASELSEKEFQQKIPQSKEVLKNKRRSESIPSNMSNSEKILRRCLSSQSYLTPDLVEKIAAQAQHLSLSEGYLPEDYIRSCNDGSSLVSPNSKLSEKKRLSPQNSSEQTKVENVNQRNDQEKLLEEEPPEKPSHESNKTNTEKREEQLSTESCHKSENKQEETISIEPASTKHSIEEKESSLPATVPENGVAKEDQPSQESKPDKVVRTPRKRISSHAFEKTQEEISKAIQSFLGKEDLTPENILSLLEDEFGSLLDSQRLSPEDRELIEQLRKSASASQLAPSISTQEDIVEKVENITEAESEAKTKEEISEDKITNEDSTKDQSVSNISQIKNKTVENLAIGEKRRHSIDDLDSWFSPNAKSEDFRDIKRRREASLPDCLESYDSDDEKKLQIVPEKVEPKKSSISSGNDHSLLLRFLENEKINYYD